MYSLHAAAGESNSQSYSIDLTTRIEEQAIVARVRNSDGAALEEIFRKYAPQLISFAHSYSGSRETAKDIVQDLFLSIWARHEQWEVTTSLRAYLYRAVRNKLRDRVRDSSAERQATIDIPSSVIDTTVHDTTRGPVQELEDSELRIAIQRALSVLPERPKQVFIMSREQRLSYVEISQVLGVSVKTVETHMSRALSALRAALGEWWP